MLFQRPLCPEGRGVGGEGKSALFLSFCSELLPLVVCYILVMNQQISRILVSVTIVGGVVAGAYLLDLAALAETSCTFQGWPVDYFRLQDQSDRSKALTAQRERVQAIAKQKRALAHELLAGRLTLRQAAGLYWDVSKNAPYPWDHCARNHPEWSLEVRCAKYVIEEVTSIVMDESNRHPAELVAKLEAEKESW
jgi:hypothetical protein